MRINLEIGFKLKDSIQNLTGDLNELKQNMQVGTFCIASDSTHGLDINKDKAVMSALVAQVQQPTGKRIFPSFLSLGRR
eukprot:7294168-Ditylum_brightwellii.AAC.1